MANQLSKPATARNAIGISINQRQKYIRSTLILAIATLLVSSAVYAQIAERIVPIISFLLSDEVDNRVKAIPKNRLNDTGITKGMDLNGLAFNQTCVADAPGAQDCHYGRDLEINSDADGLVGFSYTFIDDEGQLQNPQDKDSACAVLDNVTGLMWDSGRPEPGLKSLSATFTWFTNDSAPILDQLVSDGQADTCPGYISGIPATYCNTHAYIARLNSARWCGHNDWRLATMTELGGLQHFNDGSANASQTWLSANHFFEIPESWSSNLFLFDGFLSNPAAGYFLHVANFSSNSTGFVSKRFLRSDRPTSILVVRND